MKLKNNDLCTCGHDYSDHEPWKEGESWDCRACGCKDMVHTEQPCGCSRCTMMRVQEIRKNKTSYYHKKVSKDSVLCGESIFGLLTNAEGYEVTCPLCRIRMVGLE